MFTSNVEVTNTPSIAVSYLSVVVTSGCQFLLTFITMLSYLTIYVWQEADSSASSNLYLTWFSISSFNIDCLGFSKKHQCGFVFVWFLNKSFHSAIGRVKDKRGEGYGLWLVHQLEWSQIETLWKAKPFRNCGKYLFTATTNSFPILIMEFNHSRDMW